MIKKFQAGLLLNYSSLIVMALSGVMINILIVQAFGTYFLGKFNFIYAIYIIVSQVATFGIHYSALQSLSIRNKDEDTAAANIVCSALVLGFIISVVVCFLLCTGEYLVGKFAFAASSTFPVLPIAVALPFFTLNKITLASFNGLCRMGIYSLGQGLRYFFMLVFITVCCYIRAQFSILEYAFLYSELLLFCVLMPVMYRNTLNKQFRVTGEWIKKHGSFGFRSFFSGISQELNSRVDIIMLTFLTTPQVAGIYSFASTVIEGFGLILGVIRNNANPIYAKLYFQKKENELQIFMRKVRNFTYLGASIILMTTIFVYTHMTKLTIFPHDLANSTSVLMLGGIMLLTVSGYVPFSDFLSQANFPHLQSFLNVTVVIINIFLCYLLIPLQGAYGAMAAYVFSTFIFSVFLIAYLSKKKGFQFFRFNHFA